MKIKNSFEKQAFIVGCLVDLTPKFGKGMFQSIYYQKPNSDYIFFELWKSDDLKISFLDCSFLMVWNIFKNEFDMENEEIDLFMKIIVKKYTKWGLIRPDFPISHISFKNN